MAQQANHNADGEKPRVVKPMGANIQQAYKEACDNLMYLKKEQFQVTYYTWALLAALFLLSSSFPRGRPILFFGAFAVGILSVLTLIYFQRSLKKFRLRLAFIYGEYFSDEERTGLFGSAHAPARRKLRYAFVLLCLTCSIGSVFTAWAIIPNEWKHYLPEMLQ